MAEGKAVQNVEIAFCHRQVIDGVQQVCLALAVVSVDAVQPAGELDLSFRDVLEIRKADPLEVHKDKDTQMSAEKRMVINPTLVVNQSQDRDLQNADYMTFNELSSFDFKGR